VREGDFVFLDPPYVTRHNNNGFIEYNERIFSWRDQQRLASTARALTRRGVNVMVTNALHSDVINLYQGFNVVPVERSSTIASDNQKRGRVREAIIFSYPKS
jgi:DNA adenine methylase